MVLIKLSDEPCLYELIQLLLSSVINLMLGRGGGQVVSMLALYSDDPSSNPAEVYNFSVKIVIEKNENKQKEAGVGPFFLINLMSSQQEVF